MLVDLDLIEHTFQLNPISWFKLYTKYDRVFSPPPNLDTYITKETKNKGNKNYVIGYDDSFKNYLTYVIKYLNNDRKQINREFFNQNYEYEKLLRQ